MEIEKEKLQQELARQRQLAASIRSGLEESQTDSLSELSAYDNHPADLGAETFERSKDLSLLEQTRLRAEALEAALRRWEAGEYGVCERCGRPIEGQRLEAIPEARLCVACQEETETSGRERPLEEEALAPPFARTFTDGSDSTAFDGEDSWQAVARYGTSESPQDVPGAVSYDDLAADHNERIGAVEDVETLSESDEPPNPGGRGNKDKHKA